MELLLLIVLFCWHMRKEESKFDERERLKCEERQRKALKKNLAYLKRTGKIPDFRD